MADIHTRPVSGYCECRHWPESKELAVWGRMDGMRVYVVLLSLDLSAPTERQSVRVEACL